MAGLSLPPSFFPEQEEVAQRGEAPGFRTQRWSGLRKLPETARVDPRPLGVGALPSRKRLTNVSGGLGFSLHLGKSHSLSRPTLERSEVLSSSDFQVRCCNLGHKDSTGI